MSAIASDQAKRTFLPTPYAPGFIEDSEPDTEIEILALKSEGNSAQATAHEGRPSAADSTTQYVDRLDQQLPSDYRRPLSPAADMDTARLSEPAGDFSRRRAGKQRATRTSGERNTGLEPNVAENAAYLSSRAADGARPLATKAKRAGSTMADGAGHLTSRVAESAQAAREQLPSWRRMAYAGAFGLSVGALSYLHAPVIVPSASYAANQLGFAGLTGGLTTAAVWAKPNLPKGLVWATAAAVMGAALTVTAVPGVTAGYLAAAVLGSAVIGYNMAPHEQALKNVLFYGVLAGALYVSFNVLEPVLGLTRAGAAA